MNNLSIPHRIGKKRKAKGFSKKELKEAQINLGEALKYGIPVDRRRSSIHNENVEALRTFLIEAKSTVVERGKAAEMETSIERIKGIGPLYSNKLADIGIETTEELLQIGSTPEGRKEIATKTAISKKLILEWVNLADLFRIKGIGEKYSDLLEEAGVDTVVELSRRVPENLHTRLAAIKEDNKLVRRTPSIEEVTGWVEQAKKLPRKIEY